MFCKHPGVDLPSVSWSSGTSVVAVALAEGALHPIRITVAALVATAATWLTYDAPSASAVGEARPNLPRTLAHARLTVHGAAFGALDLTPSAVIGGAPCSSLSWSAATAAVCVHGGGQHGAYFGTALAGFAITVDAVVGTRTLSMHMSFDAPTTSW